MLSVVFQTKTKPAASLFANLSILLSANKYFMALEEEANRSALTN